MNVPPGKKARLLTGELPEETARLIQEYAGYIQHLARVEQIEPVADKSALKSTAAIVVENLEFFLPLEGLIDLDKERQRLEKELKRLEGQFTGLQKKLSNQDFLEKAPKQVVEQEKAKLKNVSEKIKKIQENLKRLQ